MRKISFYLCFLWNLIVIFFKTFKLKNFEKKNNEIEMKKLVDKTAVAWSRSMLRSVNLHIDVEGKENIPEEACLFVGNHQSYLDIMALLYALNKSVGFVAKQELKKIRVFSYWIIKAHSVFINRSNPREGLKAIVEASNNIKNGNSMAIFPEGTRSRGEKIGEFKKGSMKAAIKAKAKIVPVTISGTYRAFEDREKGFKPIRAKVIFGEPIDTSTLSKEEQQNLHVRIREEIYSNLQK